MIPNKHSNENEIRDFTTVDNQNYKDPDNLTYEELHSD